jgi:hypothetical protein
MFGLPHVPRVMALYGPRMMALDVPGQAQTIREDFHPCYLTHLNPRGKRIWGGAVSLEEEAYDARGGRSWEESSKSSSKPAILS